MLLAIETALDTCSVALGNDTGIVLLREERGNNIHSSRLTVLIDELLKEAKVNPADLEAIIVGKGPGSYTGLRIGVSVAKGLAYVLDKPLISVNTLLVLAWMAKKNIHNSGDGNLLYPMIDARRMEVYYATYNTHLFEVNPPAAMIVDKEFIANLPTDKPLYFFGNGMNKCREMLSALPNAICLDNIEPSARPLIDLGKEKFRNKEYENVTTFEPFYLKDFFTTAKKVEE